MSYSALNTEKKDQPSEKLLGAGFFSIMKNLSNKANQEMSNADVEYKPEKEQDQHVRNRLDKFWIDLAEEMGGPQALLASVRNAFKSIDEEEKKEEGPKEVPVEMEKKFSELESKVTSALT